MSFLNIPVALWDQQAPTGQISKIAVSKSGEHVILGFIDGKVYICELRSNKFVPKLLLFGHTCEVVGITEVAFKNVPLLSDSPETAIISAAKDGMLISWDFRDGRCRRKARALPGRVTTFKTLRSERHVVACGLFANIYIIDAVNLNTVKIFPTLSSGFILCGSLFLYSESSRTLGEGFLALSMSGMLECFSLRTNKRGVSSGPPIKPKRLDYKLAVALHVNPFTNASLIIVSESSCAIHLMDNLEFLMEILCPDEQGWAGGMFCRHAEILLWTKTGRAFHYFLPEELDLPIEGPAQLYETIPNRLSADDIATNLAEQEQREMNRVVGEKLQATIRREFEKNLIGAKLDTGRVDSTEAIMEFNLEKDLLIYADTSSNINIWSSVRQIKRRDVSGALITPDREETKKVLPITSTTLDESWVGPGKQADGNLHHLLKDLTCHLQLNRSGLIFGYRSGALSYAPISEILKLMLVDSSGNRLETTKAAEEEEVEDKVVSLAGHGAAVTCLLQPFVHGAPVDAGVFVSGSSDNTVRVWHQNKLHHTFTNQAGKITTMFCPPASSVLLRRGCFCSVALDHSLAIYSIDAKACIHLFSGCSSPIQDVRWRCTDDYVIVYCDDGTAYIWQLSTGHLDRKATGQLALDIMAQCDATTQLETSNKSEHGLDFRLIDVSPNRGKLPVLILDVEHLITSLSRKSSSSSVPAMSARNLLLQLLSILLNEKEINTSPQIREAFDVLQLQYCSDSFTYGVCNEGYEIYSFILPTMAPGACDVSNVDQSSLADLERWCLSSEMSTAHLLATMSLLHALNRTVSDHSLERVWQIVMKNFANQSHIKKLPEYKRPALLQLALLWEHWQHDIQRVARAQLQSHLKHMGQMDRQQIVSFASARLPSSVRDHGNEEKLASAILLGVMAHVHKDALKVTHGTAKRVADALTDIVQNENAATKHRAAAAEVLGKAYESFKQYCNLSDIFLILTELAASTTAGSQATVALHALKNLALSNIHQFVEAINTQMFITTGHFHGHNSMLKVLKIILKTHPKMLAPELPKVVDVVVRCFDPSTPKIRESCFKSAMGVFHEMRPVYPMMGLFDARLAVGCPDGLINIYELKSATRWQAIPAHATPITAISFSYDGKMLASFSIHEKTVRVWHVVGSFFGMISSAPKCISTFNVPDAINSIGQLDALTLKLVWTNKKKLVLMTGDQEFMFAF